VGTRRFKNRARREWWLIHIEAWQRSGLPRSRYCAQQRLCLTTFVRWLRLIGDVKPAEYKVQRAHRRGPSRLGRSKRSTAIQAFWAMHVEALNWSGQTVTHYAAALNISAHSLRRWRDLFEAEELSIDWRAKLHPSALPKISTRTSSAAKESGVESDLPGAANGEPSTDGRPNRRHFTHEQKLAIVLECERPGATISAVARAHKLATSALFRWRAELGYGRKETVKLAAVKLPNARSAGGARNDAVALVLHDMLQQPDGMEVVELADGRRVFAPIGSDPNAVRHHVAEQENGR
jgi:transposase-like protein